MSALPPKADIAEERVGFVLQAEPLRRAANACSQGDRADWTRGPISSARSIRRRRLSLKADQTPGRRIGRGNYRYHGEDDRNLFRQPVLVENRPGAGGNLAAEAVARSNSDGYTLLVSFTSHTINATLYPKLPFDPVADFTPIAMISTVPSLLVGNPKIPAQNLKELIALAKAKPDALTMAIGGIGSSLHLAGDRFKMMADVNIVNVPYKGTAPGAYRRIGWAGGSDVH